MPVVDRWHTHHWLLGNCFRLMSQVQETDHRRSLTYFRSFVLFDGFLDFGQFFRFQWIDCSHSKSVSCLIIYFERLLKSLHNRIKYGFLIIAEKTRCLYADHADNTDCEAFRKRRKKSIQSVKSVYKA